MSYRDINDYLAEEKDWLCTRCDMPLDRIGSHCKSCMVELQEEIDHLRGRAGQLHDGKHSGLFSQCVSRWFDKVNRF